MAAPYVEPPTADDSSVPPVPVPPVPEPSLPQPEIASNPQPVASDRSADSLVITLAEASRQFDGTGADPERNCWMAVHQHLHGVLPSEYDIREIDEDLYLAVLAYRRSENAGS
jgi:hypothetical protein